MRHVLFLFFYLLMLNFISAQDKVNVVLFVVDDLGYYDLSVTGSALYETPNIDALANEGMMFSNAYVSHPRCVPSRYAIQTGKFPARAQIPGGRYNMEPEEINIGEAFQQAGYTTFFAGKWHLGKREAAWPLEQGYDYNIGGGSAGAPISYFFPYNVNKGKKSSGNHKKIQGLDEGVEGEYLTDRLTKETISFIKKQGDKPFFALLSHYGVHTPIQAKQEDKKKYKAKVANQKYSQPEYVEKDGTTKMRQDNATYAAMIQSVDESLGRIVETLKEQRLYENTVIIFTSDHGGLSNRGVNNKRELATANLPLRAGKGHVYEGGVKVPFIVYWNKKVKPGSVSSQVTVNTDIFPTLLDIAGIPKMPEAHKDGLSIIKALKGKKNIERTLFWHSPVGRPNSTGDENCSAIRVGDYKLIDFYDQDKVELYQLSQDPYETSNIAFSEPDIAQNLLEELNQWKKEIKVFIKN